MKKAVSVLLVLLVLLFSASAVSEGFRDAVPGRWWSSYARPEVQIGFSSVFFGKDGSLTWVQYFSEEMFTASMEAGQWTTYGDDAAIMAVGGQLMAAYLVDGSLYIGTPKEAQKYWPGVAFDPKTDYYYPGA